MGVPGMLHSSSFLISVCMFIVSKALLISSATVIVRAWGTNWLNPFAMLLFTECSAVTVECCILYLCCVGVFGMFERLCKEEGSYPVSAITEWRDMGMYEVPLSMSLLGFRIWTMVANFHIIFMWYYVGVKDMFGCG